MTSATDYLENKIRDHVLLATTYTSPATVYVALFTTAPTDTAGSGTEVAGGSYARQAVDFDAGATGVAVSSADETFAALPACVVTHLGIFDASTGGNLLLHGPLAASKTVAAGADLVFPAGDISATVA